MPDMIDSTPQMTDGEIVSYVNDCRQQSSNAFAWRRERARVNRDAYNNIQDFSNKIEGQSREFIPRTSETVEQMTAFLKRGLTQFGNWFSVDMGKKAPLSPQAVTGILDHYLSMLPTTDGKTQPFPTVLGDNLKVGLLEAPMVFKIHGHKVEQTVFFSEAGDEKLEIAPFKLFVDAVKPENYYKDPTGHGLYEIHRCERDLHYIKRMAKMGVYDEDVLDMVQEDFRDQDRQIREAGQELPVTNSRRRCVIDEFWGTVLDSFGEVVHHKVLLTVLNQKYLIRKPVPFPSWDAESCFVEIPILRTPFTQMHKALYDEVVPLNLALNELFNLMLDGGIASVWGVRQLRTEFLEDPESVADGIPQGKTLPVKDGTPEGAKVLETVTTGNVPPDALNMFNILSTALVSAAKTNDVELGGLPQKQVRATEIVEASQNRSAIMDSIVADIEAGLEQVLAKSWRLLLQNADDLSTGDLQEILSRREALMLARMEPRERYLTMGTRANFKVSGLSATLHKARDFQKIMALIQAVGSNPLLLQAFMKKYSGEKILTKLIRVLNLNPDDFQLTEDDDPQGQANDTMMLQQMMGGGQGVNTGTTGEPGLPSEITQTMKPSQVA